MKKQNTAQKVISCCAVCKKVKRKDGSWHTVMDSNIAHLNAILSHGYCETCFQEFIATIQ